MDIQRKDPTDLTSIELICEKCNETHLQTKDLKGCIFNNTGNDRCKYLLNEDECDICKPSFARVKTDIGSECQESQI